MIDEDVGTELNKMALKMQSISIENKSVVIMQALVIFFTIILTKQRIIKYKSKEKHGKYTM